MRPRASLDRRAITMSDSAQPPVRRWGRFIVVIPALALCGLVPLAARFEVQRPTTEATTGCTVRLNASRFPEIIPEYWIWERLFQDLQESAVSGALPQLGERDSQILSAQAVTGLSRAKEARAKVTMNARAERDAAETLLASRDDFAANVDAATYFSVRNAAVGRAAIRNYDVPVQGRVVDGALGGSKGCVASIKGGDYPHLIPESEYWRLHLHHYAMISAKYRIGADQFQPFFVTELRVGGLQLSDEDLSRFLRIATQVTEAIEQMPAAQSRDVAAVALRARDSLLRGSSNTVWQVLRRDAARSRYGVTFTFPPAPL
jgi:hypothetical protein